MAFEEPVQNLVKYLERGLCQFITEFSAVTAVATQNHIGQAVRSGILDPFYCQSVGFLAVFYLELRLTIKAFIFLEHAEGHKPLWGDVRFVARAVRLLIRVFRQIKTPVEPVFTLIGAFLFFSFVIPGLLSVDRFIVAALLTFAQRPTFGVHTRTAYTTLGGDPFVVEVHRGSLCRHLILIKQCFFKRV